MLLVFMLAAFDAQVTACLDDDAEACFALGQRVLTENNAGAPFEALQHFRRACELQLAEGCAEAAQLTTSDDEAARLNERAERYRAPPVELAALEWSFSWLDDSGAVALVPLCDGLAAR